MKKNLLLVGALALTMGATAQTNVALLVPAEPSAQEAAAKAWFQATYPDAVVTSDAAALGTPEAVVVFVDHAGVVPEEINAAAGTLKTYLENGGNIYLAKWANMLAPALGILPEDRTPNIAGVGGGDGWDNWNMNAYLGSWQENPNCGDPDASQVYDRRGHAIFEGLVEKAKGEDGGFNEHPSFPLIGTDDWASALYRDDNNCMWDLNGYDGFYKEGEGKNTLENFELVHNCTVLATWGHVQDYCVAGIVDFPAQNGRGAVIANGLAAYQFETEANAGKNVFADNVNKLSSNIVKYLTPASSAVRNLNVEAEGAVEYYNLQGVRVSAPQNGLFIKKVGNKAVKVIIK